MEHFGNCQECGAKVFVKEVNGKIKYVWRCDHNKVKRPYVRRQEQWD